MNRRPALFAIAGLFAGPAFALYDPPPDAALSAAQGEWKGSLTYRDYRQPDRLVTLPTRLFVALGGPSEIVLHYLFDDGPAKAVFSYERMSFNFETNELAWSSGSAEKTVSVCHITSNTSAGAARQLTFERRDGDRLDRYTLVLSRDAFRLGKQEIDAAGVATFRNRYEFSRPAA